MPYSKIKANIAEVLKAEGYVSTWLVEEPAEDSVGKTLVVELKYGLNRERSWPASVGCPSLVCGVYSKAQEMPRVLGGLGIAIIPPRTAAHRPSGPQAKRRRGSPRLGLVAGD